MRHSIIIIIAMLLACPPVGATAHPVQDGGMLVLEPGQLPGDQALPLILFSVAPGGDGIAYDVSLFAIDPAGHVSEPVALRVVAAPVPEPMSVLMLACGLLLIMPGAWLGRWSRLGDRVPMLQGRLP